MKPRPYQAAAIRDCRQAFKRSGPGSGVFLVAPTGSGKTVILAFMILSAVAKGGRVLLLVPRREILFQTAAKLESLGVPHGLIAAGVRNLEPGAPVQLAMAWSMPSRDLPWWPTLVIIDEAHLARAKTFDLVLSRWAGPRQPFLLLDSATPWRTDGLGFDTLCDELVVTPGIPDLTHEGYLVPLTTISASAPELAGLRRGAKGDFAPGMMAQRYMRPSIVGDTVQAYRQHGDGRRAVVFASSVEHSKLLTSEFQAAGYRWAHVDGNTPTADRERIMGGPHRPGLLELGEIDGVSNYGICCEGWDCPPVEVGIIARATESKALYFQMGGRILRPSSATGKTGATLIDQGLNWLRHNTLIDMPQSYSLKGTKGERQGGGRAAPSVRTCKGCLAMFAANVTVCPRCGLAHQPDARRDPKMVRGIELYEIEAGRAKLELAKAAKAARRKGGDPVRPKDCDRDVWRRIEAERKEKGYKPNWSYVHAKIRQGARSWRGA